MANNVGVVQSIQGKKQSGYGFSLSPYAYSFPIWLIFGSSEEAENARKTMVRIFESAIEVGGPDS